MNLDKTFSLRSLDRGTLRAKNWIVAFSKNSLNILKTQYLTVWSIKSRLLKLYKCLRFYNTVNSLPVFYLKIVEILINELSSGLTRFLCENRWKYYFNIPYISFLTFFFRGRQTKSICVRCWAPLRITNLTDVSLIFMWKAHEIYFLNVNFYLPFCTSWVNELSRRFNHLFCEKCWKSFLTIL